VGPAELKAMLQSVVYGSRQERLRFLFFLTDLNNDGLITAEEMETFLQDFRTCFFRMAAGVAQVRLTCAEQGSPAAEALSSFIAAAREEADNSGPIVAEEVASSFASFRVRNEDPEIPASRPGVPYQAFANALRSLPKVYNRLVHLLTGIVERTHGQIIVGEHYAPSTSQREPSPQAVSPQKDGTHDHVTVTEEYSAYTSPSKFTLDSLRDSPTFRDALLKVDSSPAPFSSGISSPGPAGVNITC